MNNTHSIQDAVAYVTTAIEGGGGVDDAAAEYDLDGLVLELSNLVGSYDFTTLDTTTFWDYVADFQRDV